MKNVFSGGSLSSLSTNADHHVVWSQRNPMSGAGGSALPRRAMIPIRELDFESRIVLNCKLPKKKLFSEQIRKNDFVVDLNEHNTSEMNPNQLQQQHQQQQPLLFKPFKTCFTVDARGYSIDDSSFDANYAPCDDNNDYSNHTGTVQFSSPLPSSNASNFYYNSNNSNATTITNNYNNNKSNRTESINMKTFNTHNNNNLETDFDSPTAVDGRVYAKPPRGPGFGSGPRMIKVVGANYNNNINNNDDANVTSNNSDRVNDYDPLISNNKSNATTIPSKINANQNQNTKNQQQQQQQQKKPYLQPNNLNRNYKYRVWQCKIYNFLERPRGWKSGMYHILIFATVFLCLILSVLATIHQYENIASNALMYTEIVIVFWLSIELSLRVWSAGCRSRYQTWRGRLKFMKNVFCILDLTVIVASISLTVIATSQNKHKNFAAAAFRGLRFFQILRMLRVDRRAGTWRLLGTVVWAHRQELITTFYIGFLSLIISSFVMYLIEKDDEDSKIKTFADSLWWGVITLCTIGYGDVVPRTWGGKLLASSCALIGISFFALPAGILGSGFALKVQAMQRQKHLNRRRAPAATLIQCLWRCYAADPNSMSLATWKPATKAIVHAAAVAAAAHPPVVPSLSQQPVIPEYSIANIARPYIGPNSFLNRVTSLKRRMPQSTASTGGHGSSQHHPHHHINSELRHHHHQVIVPKIINENKSYIKTNSLIQLPPRDANSTPEMLASSLQSRRDAIVIPSQLFNAQTSIYSPYAPPPTQANVVMAPVASVTNGSTGGGSVGDNNPNCPSPGPDPLILADLADPPSLNNSYVMALQQVSRNRQQESSKITPVKSSLAHRTLNFLTDFNASNLLARQSDPESGDPAHQGEPNTPHGTTSSSHGKPQLTLQQKNAIRALRKIKYFVARRKFREALRPYDVTDVIEQYSAGNLDMLARIKTLQFRLDKILGSTKSKECYDSNTTSLASRIVKVERQMDDVSIKLEKFFASYTLDMKLLMEKTTENCILNETYLKYGDDVFRKEDILPTEITPSMIYHKKSVKLTPSADLVATGGSPFATSSRQGSLFRSPRSNNNKTAQDGVELITPDDDSLKLRALKEEKLQIEERIRYTLEQIKHKKAAVKSRFLFDILDDDGDDDGGSYDYDDSSNNAATLAVKSCVSSLRNESLSSAQQQVEAAAREKSRSDGLIRLVDRRRRKNKYFMRKYFINALKYKISASQLPDSSTARLKKFKSDNDVWFDEELSRHYVMRTLMLSNMCSDDDVIVIKSSRDRYAQLKLAAAATASAATSNTSNRNKEEPKKFVFEYDEMSKLLTSCNDDEKQGVETLNTCLTPCSVDPSLTSTCLIDLPDNVSQSQSLSTRGETQSQQQKKEPPPPLRPMTTGYFSLHFDQPPSSGEPENNSDIKSPSSESQ